ncbi:DUF1963 domain-containing protein [Massilia atriviolacea]|uniref:DUF1963 domain-containing protein n=1 Tax=Massilia atriviolacea TaxID=2495579 RepID=A0A430HQT9_9BURK|nr:DUF1963 domain-containing protein [Massilia atriviolacea]RSZ59863.1 DUF1963 domain-containing protein [Massilia atriviolacea]
MALYTLNRVRPPYAAWLLAAATLLGACSPDQPAPAPGPGPVPTPAVVYGQLPPELARFAADIERSRLPYIALALHKPERLAPWNSSLGGAAYLPRGQAYPTGPDGVKLALLAQLNFAEMPALEGYPSRGLLQFFIAGGDSKEHIYGAAGDSGTPFDAERYFLSLARQRWFRVIYHPDVVRDRKQLQPTAVVAGEMLPMSGTSALSFDTGSEPVSLQDYRFARFFGKPPEEFFGQFGAQRDNAVVNYQAFSEKYRVAKVGGYSNPTQQDVRGTRADEDWIVLLELHGGGIEGGFHNEWGDSGMGVFYIRRQDLARRDFSNVVYAWDNH